MSERRSTLLLHLTQLQPREAPDDAVDGSVSAWVERITEAQETALLVDARGRVVAISTGCALALNVDQLGCLGTQLVELVVLVDFSASGVPVDDADIQLPPLKALRSGSLSRGLVRLRLGGGVLTTYDCVGVPLADGHGAIGFFAEV